MKTIEHEPAFQVWLFGPMTVEKRTGAQPSEELPTAAWGGRRHPRLLLKLLVLQPHRRAVRSGLLDMLWPAARTPRAFKDLTKAAGHLRRMLTTSSGDPLVLTEPGHPRFSGLAGQERLWVDGDAALDRLSRAESPGHTSLEGLRLLEKAAASFRRGDLLEGEPWPWIPRGRISRARYRCRLWLAEAYERQGRFGVAQEMFREMPREEPGDSALLFRLLPLMIHEGSTQKVQHMFSHSKERMSREHRSRFLAPGKHLGIEEDALEDGEAYAAQTSHSQHV